MASVRKLFVKIVRWFRRPYVCRWQVRCSNCDCPYCKVCPR